MPYDQLLAWSGSGSEISSGEAMDRIRERKEREGRE